MDHAAQELSSLSVAEIKALVDAGRVRPELLIAMQGDRRKGVRALAARVRKAELATRLEEERLRALYTEEVELRRRGFERVAGVDEVGAGPLAGPVVAAAVILPPRKMLPGLDDSKKIDPRKRQALTEQIKERAVAWAIGQASVGEIDVLNILEASRLAMSRAVLALTPEADHLLVDAREVPSVSMPQKAIIRGDSHCAAIAAASIIAKVYRDELMASFDERWPGYGFGEHAGYGTERHMQALERLGACPIHRRSFAPVRAVLQRQEPLLGS